MLRQVRFLEAISTNARRSPRCGTIDHPAPVLRERSGGKDTYPGFDGLTPGGSAGLTPGEAEADTAFCRAIPGESVASDRRDPFVVGRVSPRSGRQATALLTAAKSLESSRKAPLCQTIV